MTDPRRQAFKPYIQKVADMLGVGRWRIEVSDEPPNGSNDRAAIWVATFMESATLRLSDDFLEMSPEGQRETVIHEVLHVHESGQMDLLNELMGKKKYRMWRHQAERMIEAIARAIAPLFPLPEDKEA